MSEDLASLAKKMEEVVGELREIKNLFYELVDTISIAVTGENLKYWKIARELK